MKKIVFNRSLKVFVNPTMILCIAFIFSGCDSSTRVVLSSSSPSLQLTIEAKKDSAQITKLGWDTEGTGRDTINLLKSPVELYLSKGNQALTPKVTSIMADKQTIQYKFSLANKKQLIWEISAKTGELKMQILSSDDISAEVDKIELVFPFNPKKTITSIISSNWTKDGKFQLPVIVSAPDIGQLLLTSNENQGITGFTKGSREEGWVRVKFDIPVPNNKSATNLVFTPVILPIPDGINWDGIEVKGMSGNFASEIIWIN